MVNFTDTEHVNTSKTRTVHLKTIYLGEVMCETFLSLMVEDNSHRQNNSLGPVVSGKVG